MVRPTFIRLDPALVARFGSWEAAGLYSHIQFRSRDGWWTASRQTMMDELLLTRSRLDRAIMELRNSGALSSERASANDSTLKWSVLHHPDAENLHHPDVQETCTTPSRKHIEALPPRTANAERSEQENTMKEDLASVTSIDGGLFPSDAVPRRDPTPAEMANDCRNAWSAAYTEGHGRPDPEHTKLAMKHITDVAKSRETRDDWIALHRACIDSGAAGSWNVRQWIGPRPQSRFPQRTNLFAVQAQADASAGLLDSYLGIDTPARGELT